MDRDIDRCAAATGLALSRLQEDAISFSLLPGKVKEMRKFLARDLYVYCAAVLFLFALALHFYAPIRARAQKQAERNRGA